MKQMFFSALAAVFLAGPVSAAGFLYECDVKDHERARGWISPKIAIIFPDEDTVQIVDALTLTFVKKPVTGTILRNNAKRLIVKWEIEGMKADNGQSFAGVNYRASISKATGAVDIKTIPNGYDKGLSGQGSCKKRNK
ncbi:MAG: hypothetical protein WA790_11960 [Sulfitobacter sp.]